jgi:hypothetical protein
MRFLILLLALFSLPALAADHSPWVDSDDGGSVCQAQSSPSSPSQQKQQPQAYPGRYCCVHCRANEVPCNGKCIAPPGSGKKAFCSGPPGCACPGKP